MDKFTVLRGIAAPMMQANVDTGAMISSRWTRDAKIDELGSKLFYDWRYASDGAVEVPDFILNQPRYRQSKILVAGENFGCGSSRERAVWALMQFGIRCVIAPSFGEIFVENGFQNGLLPVILPQERVDAIATQLKNAAVPELTVDLEQCRVVQPDGTATPFTVPAERRTAMLEGLDELGLMLRYSTETRAFQARDRAERPWVY